MHSNYNYNLLRYVFELKIIFLFFRLYQEQITSQYDDVGMRCERDAFDTLFDCAPDKLTVVKKVIIFKFKKI